jgi:hypothetical protein
MVELGLPKSVYKDCAKTNPVKLIEIQHTEKLMTDSQVRLSCCAIIAKQGVKDQMIIKVNFFIDNYELDDDREFQKKFLNDGSPSKTKQAVVEQTFVIGFLTDSSKKRTKMDKFYDYGNVSDKDGFIDQRKVLNIMQRKHIERSKELNNFVSSTDADTQQLHNVPHIGSHDSHKVTRTIIDDLAQPPNQCFSIHK